jgi:uncharacterized protein YutE (UPF0331/DUF86 family)
LVDRDTFERRLVRLEQLLRDLRRLATGRRTDFLLDPGLQAQAERWLQLAAESCLDLAHHLISDSGWPTPTTYRQAFQTLERHGVIDAALAGHMADWASLRNILVHLYLDVDYERIWEVLTGELSQLEDFTRCIVAFVEPENRVDR